MKIRPKINQNDWDMEAKEYREIQARVIDVFEKERILPRIAIHMLKDIIKSFKEEIAEILRTEGKNEKTNKWFYYCECKRNYKGLVVCSKCGLWKMSSLSTNKKLTRKQMKDILWHAYHPDGIKRMKYAELFNLGVKQGYWEKPSKETRRNKK